MLHQTIVQIVLLKQIVEVTIQPHYVMLDKTFTVIQMVIVITMHQTIHVESVGKKKIVVVKHKTPLFVGVLLTGTVKQKQEHVFLLHLIITVLIVMQKEIVVVTQQQLFVKKKNKTNVKLHPVLVPKLLQRILVDIVQKKKIVVV
jgi:hypothetical protein